MYVYCLFRIVDNEDKKPIGHKSLYEEGFANRGKVKTKAVLQCVEK